MAAAVRAPLAWCGITLGDLECSLRLQKPPRSMRLALGSACDAESIASNSSATPSCSVTPMVTPRAGSLPPHSSSQRPGLLKTLSSMGRLFAFGQHHGSTAAAQHAAPSMASEQDVVAVPSAASVGDDIDAQHLVPRDITRVTERTSCGTEGSCASVYNAAASASSRSSFDDGTAPSEADEESTPPGDAVDSARESVGSNRRSTGSLKTVRPLTIAVKVPE